MSDERKRSAASGDARGEAAPARGAGKPRKPSESDLGLPHERDEAPAGQREDSAAPEGPREVIEQAQRDIRRGLVDTDRHGVPSDVPGPGADPEHSEGAAVPPGGVSRKRPRKIEPGGG